VPARLSGDLDFYNGFQPAVSAALRALPIKLVMMGPGKVIFMILVKPEVKSLNDLKVKTIGVSSAGSTIHLSLLTILNQFRIDAAKQAGMIDAATAENLTKTSVQSSAATVASPKAPCAR